MTEFKIVPSSEFDTWCHRAFCSADECEATGLHSDAAILKTWLISHPHGRELNCYMSEGMHDLSSREGERRAVATDTLSSW